MPKKGGRPKFKFDYEAVTKLALIGCTDTDVAFISGCSPDTIQRRLKKDDKTGLCADEELRLALAKGRAQRRKSIHAKQFEVAMRGNCTMLIWLGKNYLGQTDNPLNIKIDKKFDGLTDKELSAIAAQELEAIGWTCINPDE